MDFLEQIIGVLTPVLLMGVVWLMSRVVAPLRAWFQQNADNAFVSLLFQVVNTIVEELDQLDAVTPVAKKQAAIARTMSALKPQRARVEAVTGQSLESFADSAIESSVGRLKRAKKAVETVGPPSAGSKRRPGRPKATSTSS